MNYETRVAEFFVQRFWINVSEGFERFPVGARDTVVDRRDVIALLDVGSFASCTASSLCGFYPLW
jgi:hypothetical protein